MKSLKHEYRYKSVVIPVVHTNDVTKFVVVQDSKYNELTFVVGGCKKNESIKQCAIRELYEETRGALGKIYERDLLFKYKFESRNRSKLELKKDIKEGVFVTMVYNVFFVYIEIDDFKTIRDLFVSSQSIDEETNDIMLLTKDELHSSNMWRFMKQHVLISL